MASSVVKRNAPDKRPSRAASSGRYCRLTATGYAIFPPEALPARILGQGRVQVWVDAERQALAFAAAQAGERACCAVVECAAGRRVNVLPALQELGLRAREVEGVYPIGSEDDRLVVEL
ncbi:MAG: hypothetical protein ABIG44_18920 [Planctomycetota bacterium]